MKKITSQEWNALGVKLYGNRRIHWKFKCPNCNGVQTALDFIPYKRLGAPPVLAMLVCKDNVVPASQRLSMTPPCRATIHSSEESDLVFVTNEAGKVVPTFPFAHSEPLLVDGKSENRHGELQVGDDSRRE